MGNPVKGFNFVSKLLHWFVAILMLLLTALGWYMVNLDYYHPWYYLSFAYHQWLGIVVWIAGVTMLLWNRISTKPTALTHVHKIEKYAAKLVHLLLISAVLATPIFGLIVTVADGNPLRLGRFEITLSLEITENQRDLAIASHYYLAYGTLVLVVLHVTAALKHQFIDKNNGLSRMLW